MPSMQSFQPARCDYVPGFIFEADAARITGWAWHGRFPTYNVLLHITLRKAVLRSVIADKPGPEGAPDEAANHWFDLDISEYNLKPEELADLGLLIGETDEFISPLANRVRKTGPISIEEILAAPFRRPWIAGHVHIDAERAGLSPETIVDMFYRDYLLRPADGDGLAHYAGQIRRKSMTYEGLRHDLLGSDEYKQRKRHSYDAPGAIFSQHVVLLAPELAPRTGAAKLSVSVSDLLALDDVAFIRALYSQILGRDADADGEAHYLKEIQAGRAKLDLVYAFFAEIEAIARGVKLVDVPGEVVLPASSGPKAEPSGRGRSASRISGAAPVARPRVGWRLYGQEEAKAAAPSPEPVAEAPAPAPPAPVAAAPAAKAAPPRPVRKVRGR